MSKFKPTAKPVLQKNIFVPNYATLPIKDSVRVIIQIILENNQTNLIKILEIIDESTNTEAELLTPIIKKNVRDTPLVRAEMVISSKEPPIVELPSVKIEPVIALKSAEDFLVIIASKMLKRKVFLRQTLNSLEKDGYVLTREELNCDCEIDSDMEIISIHKTEKEKLILIRQKVEETNKAKFLKMTENFEWLLELQELLQCGHKDVVIVSQNEPFGGLCGFLNCIRLEEGCERIRGVFIMDTDVPNFNPELSFYKKQLDKHLSVNIYKNGKWGTYRHLLLDKLKDVESEHSFINFASGGDVSSLRWEQGPIKIDENAILTSINNSLVHVIYF